MAGETNKSHLALLLSLPQSFSRSIRPDEQVGIVLKNDTVDLPKIQMIRLQTTERFLKHSHGNGFVAAVRTYFRHKKNAIAFSFESRSEPLFRLPPVILPAIVEKCDAAVQRFVHDLRGDLLVVGITEVMAATGYSRNGNAGASKVAHRHFTAAVWHYIEDPTGGDTFRDSPLGANAAVVPEGENL